MNCFPNIKRQDGVFVQRDAALKLSSSRRRGSGANNADRQTDREGWKRERRGRSQ